MNLVADELVLAHLGKESAMRTYHLAIFGADVDAKQMEDRLDTLGVPDVTRYGTTVQVAIPGFADERDHWDAIATMARAVSDDFKLGRASGT